jgi:hypothetical protein
MSMTNDTQNTEGELGFEDALDWAFSQIISPDNMLPTLADQKAWILKEHNEALATAHRKGAELALNRLKGHSATMLLPTGPVKGVNVLEIDAALAQLKSSTEADKNEND